MDRSDERLKELMKSLADAIGQVFNGNDEIKNALALIEHEGYSVDMIVASVTRLSGKNEKASSDAGSQVSDFDRSFLSKIRVKIGDAEEC